MVSAPSFGLSDTAARTVLAEIYAATSGWRDAAAANGVRRSECTRFEDAFWVSA